MWKAFVSSFGNVEGFSFSEWNSTHAGAFLAMFWDCCIIIIIGILSYCSIYSCQLTIPTGIQGEKGEARAENRFLSYSQQICFSDNKKVF